jgi:hypothetical protein
MTEVALHFFYDKSRVLQALRYHFITRKELRVMLIAVNVFALLSITLYAFKLVTPLAFMAGSFLWIFLMISFWFVMPALVFRKTQAFRHEFSMKFSDGGFSLAPAEGLEKQWNWNQLQTYLESPHFFHLYFNPQSFWLVPKSACKDTSELLALRAVISSHVKKG